MNEFPSIIGFVIIPVLYIAIRLLAIAGLIVVTRTLFSPRHKQALYAFFLVIIGGFYLAFTAYYGGNKVWALGSCVVLVFTIFGILSMRIPAALILAYPLNVT